MILSNSKKPIAFQHLEMIVDANYNTWLIGSKGIHFFDANGNVDKDMDKEAISFQKVCEVAIVII
jgi:hypothetical protein